MSIILSLDSAINVTENTDSKSEHVALTTCRNDAGQNEPALLLKVRGQSAVREGEAGSEAPPLEKKVHAIDTCPPSHHPSHPARTKILRDLNTQTDQQLLVNQLVMVVAAEEQLRR